MILTKLCEFLKSNFSILEEKQKQKYNLKLLKFFSYSKFNIRFTRLENIHYDQSQFLEW